MTEMVPLDSAVLPPGIRSRFVHDINGLRMHMLEAGFEADGRPLVLLLHGFPELAYSWRKVMLPLAAAGFHVVAPDQRGYGRTTGWDADYDGDLGSFRLLNAGAGCAGLVVGARLSLGRSGRRARFRRVGRGLVRADPARRVPLRRADERAVRRPAGTALRHGDQATPQQLVAGGDIHDDAGGARSAAQALPMVLFDPAGQCRHARLPAGRPRLPARLFPLQERGLDRQQAVPAESWTAARAGEDADLLHHGARQGHGGDRRRRDAVGRRRSPHAAGCPSTSSPSTAPSIERTGFQGGLQWYRCRHAKAATMPSSKCSPAGRSTCRRSSSPGQATGAFIRAPAVSSGCRERACPRMCGCHLIDGAGHWVQQEQPERVCELLIEFLQRQ